MVRTEVGNDIVRVGVGRVYSRKRATRWLATILSMLVALSVSASASADPSPADTPVHAKAAAAPDNVPGTLIQMVDVVPGVAPKLAAATSNLASAVLQAAPSGAQFRVAVMPGYLAPDYIDVLSEAKITAVTDPATNLTTAALSLSYNPFAMRGDRGSAIWRHLVAAAKCGDNKYPVVPEAVGMGTASEEKKKQVGLADALVKRDSDALATAENEFENAMISLAESTGPDKTSLATAVSNGRLHRDEARSALQLARQARDKTEAEYEALQVAESTARDAAAQKAFEQWKQALTKCFDGNIRSEFWHELDATWVPQVMATVGYDFYPGGTAPNPLDKTGTTIALLEPWGGVRAELSVLFRPHERFEFEIFAQARRVRPNGAPYTQLANYAGGGATLAWMAWTALPETAARASNADYRKSGALPGVVLGLSGQSLSCDGFANCASGQITAESLTPFVDIKVLNAAQFRISLPMKWSQNVVANTFIATPTFSTAGAFAGL